MPTRAATRVSAMRTQRFGAAPDRFCGIEVQVKSVDEIGNGHAFILMTVTPHDNVKTQLDMSGKHWSLSFSIDQAEALATMLSNAVNSRTPLMDSAAAP